MPPRIAYTFLFTPNPDKLTLFCLVENWPEEPQYCPEYKGNRVACSAGRYRGLIHCACTDMHKEYESARTRALQEAVPFEDQRAIKWALWNDDDILEQNGLADFDKWQPREGDNWKVPEGLKWEKVNVGCDKCHLAQGYVTSPDCCGDYHEVIRLKAAEPSVNPFGEYNIPEDKNKSATYVTKAEPSGDAELQESDNDALLHLLKIYEENRDSGRDYSQVINILESKFNITRKP